MADFPTLLGLFLTSKSDHFIKENAKKSSFFARHCMCPILPKEGNIHLYSFSLILSRNFKGRGMGKGKDNGMSYSKGVGMDKGRLSQAIKLSN